MKKKRDYSYGDCFRIGYISIKSRIFFRVMTSHYISHTINKYAKLNLAVKVELAGQRIHKKLICPEHFTDNMDRKYFHSALKQRLSNKMIYSKENSLGRPRFR